MKSDERLCSATEWQDACAVAGQYLVGMTTGWEWLRSISETGADRRGSGGCTASGTANLLDQSERRCCHSFILP